MTQHTADFHRMLESKQRELTNRIADIKQDFANGRSADFSEQTTERENDDVLRSLQLEANIELQQVNHALARLKEGEYGICTGCGQDIDEARLLVVPHAQYCVKCAS